MHTTIFHQAFLTSPSVTTRTPLGQRIIAIAQRHHACMEREVAVVVAKKNQAIRDSAQIEAIKQIIKNG